MEVGLTVYMDRRDMTSRAVEVTLGQSQNTVHTVWTVTLAGTVSVPAGSSWDFYATTDPANPRAEALLIGGIVAPDKRAEVTVDAQGRRLTRVTGYDRSWLLQRRTPSPSIVIAQDWRRAARAVAEYRGVLGPYQVLYANTVGLAVRRLGELGGVRVRWGLPEPPLRATVLDPGKTYWEAMVELARPFGPATYYWPSVNTLAFLSGEARRRGVGGVLDIGDKYKLLEAVPLPYRKPRRVVMRFRP